MLQYNIETIANIVIFEKKREWVNLTTYQCSYIYLSGIEVSFLCFNDQANSRPCSRGVVLFQSFSFLEAGVAGFI